MDFIYEEAVKVYSHGKSEGQAGAHTGGILLHGFPEIRSQFGKIFHETEGTLVIGAIDTAYEPEIVHTREASLKGAGKSQRPGHAHFAINVSRCGRFGAADDANERGFPCTVEPQDADSFSFENLQIDPLEHSARPFPCLIDFGNILKDYQWCSTL